MSSSGEPRTAEEWMARLRSERSTTEDQAAYEQWLDASPENRASAARLDQVWQLTGALEDDPMVQAVLAPPQPRARSSWSTVLAPRLAAGVLFCLTLAFVAWMTGQFLAPDDSYETASGEQRVVDLADGSRLHLNVTTKLEVALRSDVRDVRLVRGQAFFEVVPDPDRPFVVTAGDKEITVLGTKFDVLLQDGETRVTVIEGRVAVASLGASESDTPRLPAERAQPEAGEPAEPRAEQWLPDALGRLELTTRDAIRWPASAPPSPLASTPAIAAVEEWLDGRVVFDSTPLQQAVAELDRYAPVGVRLDSPELGEMTVSGVFYIDRLADIDSLVFALENSLPLVVERRGDELLLLASD